ncbi:cysteine peptidase family C39 domain-containing protein [Anaerolentibacter hominis]|uniref:cysteine peptidase family C39 domain-containing protein n=1 Tax=Anaerolentibacter hominis TaxID=3079009 RepID=UPI0031B866D7
MRWRYPCVIQHKKYDCGAACLTTIARAYGIDVTLDEVCRLAGTDETGTNMLGLAEAAQELGFEAQGVQGDKEAFLTEDFALPCIAHMTVRGKADHYVVVHQITKEWIWIADPAAGLKKIRPEKFFGEKFPGKSPRYRWTGILLLLEKKKDRQDSLQYVVS